MNLGRLAKCCASLRKAGWFLAVLALGLTSMVQKAGANGLPLAATVQSSGGTLGPAANTTVAVVHEHLMLDLRERVARIRATYQLRNLSQEVVNVSVAFPVPEYSGVNIEKEAGVVVQLDGQPLPVQPASAPLQLEHQETSVTATWLDPFTGDEYHPTVLREPKPPAFLIFSVPFAGGQERRLQVEYKQFASQDHTRFVEPALRYDYLLQPARHWASFGELQVEVLVPSNRVLRSIPPLMSMGENLYSATFPGLPTENLSVFMSPGGGGPWLLASWWWQRPGRAWLLVAITAVGSFAAGWLRLAKAHSLYLTGTALRYGIPIAIIALTPSHLFEPNPMGVMQTWLLFVPFLVGVYLFGGWLPRPLVRGHPVPAGTDPKGGPPLDS